MPLPNKTKMLLFMKQIAVGALQVRIIPGPASPSALQDTLAPSMILLLEFVMTMPAKVVVEESIDSNILLPPPLTDITGPMDSGL